MFIENISNLLRLLEIKLSLSGSLIKLIGLELFDLRARILFTPSHVFFHICQIIIKEFGIILLFAYAC